MTSSSGWSAAGGAVLPPGTETRRVPPRSPFQSEEYQSRSMSFERAVPTGSIRAARVRSRLQPSGGPRVRGGESREGLVGPQEVRVVEDEERVGVDADDLHAVDAAPEERVRDVGDDARRVLDLKGPAEREGAETPLDVEQRLSPGSSRRSVDRRPRRARSSSPSTAKARTRGGGRRGEGLAAHRETGRGRRGSRASGRARRPVDLQPAAAHQLLRRVARFQVRGHVALVAPQRDRHRLLVGAPGLRAESPATEAKLRMSWRTLSQARVVVDVPARRVGAGRPRLSREARTPDPGQACPSAESGAGPRPRMAGVRTQLANAFGRGRRRRR